MTTPWLLIAGMGDPHDKNAHVITAPHMTRDEAVGHFASLYAAGLAVWCEIWVERNGERVFELRWPEPTSDEGE